MAKNKMCKLDNNPNQALEENNQDVVTSSNEKTGTIIKGPQANPIDNIQTPTIIRHGRDERSGRRRSSKGVAKSLRQSFCEVGCEVKNAILLNPSPSNPDAPQDEEKSFVETRQTLIFNRNLLTLRILFIDIFIVICNLASDIIQGVAISQDGYIDDGWKYAIIAMAIVWFPGIPAAIHFLSVRRLKMVWYRAILYATLLIIFYPLVPILALIIVLWMKPNGNQTTREFIEAQYGATVAYVIQGCISSPIQLCYQLYLALTGIVPFKWINLTFEITDWGGNPLKITLPTSAFCIFFSILT